MSSNTRIRFWWDENDPNNPGWYAVVSEGNHVIDDSQKVWFPVDVDDYGQDEGEELAVALQAAFPDAEIDGE